MQTSGTSYTSNAFAITSLIALSDVFVAILFIAFRLFRNKSFHLYFVIYVIARLLYHVIYETSRYKTAQITQLKYVYITQIKRNSIDILRDLRYNYFEGGDTLISVNLKKLRESKGLTRQQVADALNIKKRALETYEYGNSDPNIELINKFANFYGVTTDYLLGRESKVPETPIDAFAKDANLKELEKILIERYLELPDKQREAVLDFMRNAIAEEEARKVTSEQKNVNLVMKAARDGESPGLFETTDEEEEILNAIPDIDLDYFNTP